MIAIVVVVYLILFAVLYLFQDKFLFFPQKLSNHIQTKSHAVEEVEIEVEDDTFVRGFICKNGIRDKYKLLICFDGNAAEISYLINRVQGLDGWACVLINYRGYGLSDGTPSEKNLYNDAQRIYDYFINKDEIDKTSVVILGRSLGTGVATYLASKRSVKGVILVSPYDSIESVAKKWLWMFPISLILNNKFISINYAGMNEIPLLCIYTPKDHLIFPSHTFKLFDAWVGEKTIKKITTAAGHNDMMTNDELWENIDQFLEELCNDIQ